MKYLLILWLFLSKTMMLRIVNQHFFWFNDFKDRAISSIPHADQRWNYCDIKCLQLEKLFPNIDFYVAQFRESIWKPDIMACYGKGADGISHPWNMLVKNEFYSKVCG